MSSAKSREWNSKLDQFIGQPITSELLEKIKTPSGGYTAYLTMMLGEPYPLIAGWKSRCIGRTFRRYSREELWKNKLNAPVNKIYDQAIPATPKNKPRNAICSLCSLEQSIEPIRWNRRSRPQCCACGGYLEMMVWYKNNYALKIRR